LKKWQKVDTFDQASVETARMDFPMFVELLEELRVGDERQFRLMFDVLDAKSEGTTTLATFFAMLQAGGAGTGMKMEDAELKSKAKQDIRNHTTSAHRLVGDVKADARDGNKASHERLAYYRGSLAPDGVDTQEAPRPLTPTEEVKHQPVMAPRLRQVPHQDLKEFVLQQTSLGPATLGNHSRAGEFRKLTEKTVNNPQRSLNEVWKSLQSCPSKSEARNGMEKELLGYYQSACWSLSSDVTLLECPPSRFKLHSNAKTHRGALEVEWRRNILQRTLKE
jgi:hypothetical protein